MKPKNTICVWFDKDALEAARFYAATFPKGEVTKVHAAPSDYPGGKKGDVLTVDFTVLGIPCVGLNGGPTFKHSDRLRRTIKTRRTTTGTRSSTTAARKVSVRVVQGPLGRLMADHAAGAYGCRCGRRRRGDAGVRGDDASKEAGWTASSVWTASGPTSR
jgi:hypothetical protein